MLVDGLCFSGTTYSFDIEMVNNFDLVEVEER